MGVAALIGLVVLIVGLAVWMMQALWNWLMPFLFDVPTITYFQALGIMVLSSILFRSPSASKSK